MQPVRDHPRGATALIKPASAVAVVMQRARARVHAIRSIRLVVRFDPSGHRVRVRCPAQSQFRPGANPSIRCSRYSFLCNLVSNGF